MTIATFSGTVLAGHKEAAVAVPFDPFARGGAARVATRPGRRGVCVRASIEGHAFDSLVVSRSKRFWMLLPDEHLAAAGASAGDTVTVSLEAIAR